MSTKIYDGMRMKDYPTLDVLQDRMKSLRRKVHKAARELFVQAVANVASSDIDHMALGGKVFGIYDKQTVMSKAANEVDERHRKVEKTSERDPLYDFHFEMALLPITVDETKYVDGTRRHRTRGEVLMIPYTEQRSLLNILESQDWAEPYGYWDNTDPEKGVSKKEWDRRERDWDAALPSPSIPAQCGFTVTLHPPYPHWPGWPSAAEILDHMPTYRDRLKRLAFRKAWDEAGRKAHKKALRKDPKADPFQSFLGVERMIRETTEGKSLVAKWRKIVAVKIPRRFTVAMLKQELPEKPEKKEGKHAKR